MDETIREGRSDAKVTGLGDLAYEAMKERLIRGAFKPGHKLTVRAVAEDLKVSSTPARDALNRLINEKALVYAGPKTVIVPLLTLRELQEVTWMRLALEGLAAEKAAQNITEADLAALESLQDKITAALDARRYADALWNNKEFHFTIYSRSNLPLLLSTIESLWLRIGAAFNDLYPEFAVSKYGVHNHQAAMAGLRRGDAADVRAAMETDIRDGFRRLRTALEERAAAR